MGLVTWSTRSQEEEAVVLNYECFIQLDLAGSKFLSLSPAVPERAQQTLRRCASVSTACSLPLGKGGRLISEENRVPSCALQHGVAEKIGH